MIYLIYKGGKDYIFDIQGWQRLYIWYRRMTKIRTHLCPARLSSQWWQNMASVSWTSSAGDLQVSQDQWQSVCWQELVQSFLSLDFHFYCKINWNTASYFRKVSRRSASCFGQIDSFTFTTKKKEKKKRKKGKKRKKKWSGWLSLKCENVLL